MRNAGFNPNPLPNKPYMMNFQDWALNAGPGATHPDLAHDHR